MKTTTNNLVLIAILMSLFSCAESTSSDSLNNSDIPNPDKGQTSIDSNIQSANSMDDINYEDTESSELKSADDASMKGDTIKLDVVFEIGGPDPIDPKPAGQHISGYQKNRVLFGKYEKSEYSEAKGEFSWKWNADNTDKIITIHEDRSAHSFWLTGSDITDIQKDPNFSGIRIYPATDSHTVKLKFKDSTFEDFPYEYHTFVYYGTELVDAAKDQHDNFDQAYQFVDPCPNQCHGPDGKITTK